MSSDPAGDLQKSGGGFNPVARPRKYSIEEMEAINRFIKGFESPWIKWSIIAAGVAGVAEVLHLLWLAARYLGKF